MSLTENTQIKIEIDNYSGPLEVLLNLAKSQRLNCNHCTLGKNIYV